MMLGLFFLQVICVISPFTWWGVVVNGFNLDLATKMVYRQSPGSMFGYAVDLYSGRAGKYILVGAPQADTPHQPGVEQGGVVYRCALDRFSCTPIPFDREGNRRSAANGTFGGSVLQTESKHRQWFGASVHSSRGEDKVIACAPRYLWYYTTFYRTDPIGHCYVGENGFSTFKELSPCKHPRLYDYHQLGYCMAGFSAALPRDGGNAYMGGPGAWYWQGSLLVQSLTQEDDIKRTGIGPKDSDDSYMGYSMAVGDFDGDGVDDSALGMPRGKLGMGQVVLFNSGARNLLNLSADFDQEQFGSYFGASVSAGDIDGDGQADVIVGAPFFSLHEMKQSLVKTKYEVGRVYIYFQGAVHRFTKWAALTGEQEWARFGHSVTFAGDLNGDGYGDIVVGAPFAGEDRRGAIFVFQGKEGGIHEKHSQVIFAQDVEDNMFTFGWSLDGGRDLDENEYPDIAIGAYKSDHAVFLKSRPIITLKGDLKASQDIVDLENKECSLRDGTPVACGRLSLCLSYSGKNAPSRITVNALLQLDVDNYLSNRTLSLLPEGRSELIVPFTFSQGQSPCELRHFYLSPNIRDKLTPIKITANYSLAESQSRLRSLTPVLDYYGTTSLSTILEIKKDCGPDNNCIPDLDIVSANVQLCKKNASTSTTGSKNSPGVVCMSPQEFRIVQDTTVNMTVKIINKEEPAYEASLAIVVPPTLDYVDFERRGEFPVMCFTPEGYEQGSRNEAYNVTCDIGNPLPRDGEADLSFIFKVNDISIPRQDLTLAVNSTNPEEAFTTFNNEKTVTVSWEATPQIVLFNKSVPQTQTFSKSSKVEETPVWDFDVGPNITHVYQLRNDGPTAVENAKLDIYWPMITPSGKYLFYLSTLPRVVGPASCEVRGVENPEKLGVFDPDSEQANRVTEQRRLKRQAEEERNEGSGLFSRAFREIINRIKDTGSKGDLDAFRHHRVDCSSMQCLHIECDVTFLGVGQDVVVTIESHLWMNTLVEEFFFDTTISSAAVALVTSLPFATTSKLPVAAAVSTTKLRALKDPWAVRATPWWLWFIAALAGLVFLLLIVLLCWRSGFFKRKRPPREKALLAHPHPQTEYYGHPTYGTHL